MRIRFREAEGCEPAATTFIWDTAMFAGEQGTYGDWVLAGLGDPAQQRGGLRARMQLLTAVVLQLFSDRRLPESATAPASESEDPRGWWGNSLRLAGEPDREMGSLLWTLERNTLGPDTARLAEQYCSDALQVFVDQGACERFEVEASADPVRGYLALEVRLFDYRNKRPVLAETFEVLWQQLADPAPMAMAR